MKKLKFSYTIGGNINGSVVLEKSGSFSKDEILLPLIKHSPLRYIPKLNKYKCSHKNLYVNIHSSIIYNSKKWKQSQCPLIDESKNKCSTFLHEEE
jgi:hypothetical protein